MASVSDMGPVKGQTGFWLYGEFLGTKAGKEWMDKRTGEAHSPVLASVLVGDRVHEVEYRGLTDLPDLPERGGMIALPVYLRAQAFDSDNKPIRNARVRLGGARSSES